jgi:translation initiation factor 2 alpha subunit (eIF-2alpha)
MRYYEQRYPEVDELVMVQVRQIAEMGAYVKLVRHVFCNSIIPLHFGLICILVLFLPARI